MRTIFSILVLSLFFAAKPSDERRGTNNLLWNTQIPFGSHTHHSRLYPSIGSKRIYPWHKTALKPKSLRARHLFIVNANEMNCVDNSYGPGAPLPLPQDSQLEAKACSWDIAQSWQFANPPTDPDGREPWFALRNLLSGHCLDLWFGVNEDGHNVGVSPCRFKGNQLWRTVHRPEGTYLQSQHGKCLTMRGFPDEGNKALELMIWDCRRKTERQWWNFVFR